MLREEAAIAAISGESETTRRALDHAELASDYALNADKSRIAELEIDSNNVSLLNRRRAHDQGKLDSPKATHSCIRGREAAERASRSGGCLYCRIANAQAM